ncbi:hypothetical protein ACW95P_04690 [Candidatus Mycoplasma pogonae]
MTSDNSKLTGAYWATPKKRFLELFHKAQTQTEKKQVIASLFNLTFEHNTRWEPLELIQDPHNDNGVILKYKVYRITPIGTLAEPDKVIIHPSYEYEIKLNGFHEYQYLELPPLQLLLQTPQSFWEQQQVFVIQVNKTQKQLQLYFAQAIRAGIEAQNILADAIYNFVIQLGYKRNKDIVICWSDAICQIPFNQQNCFQTKVDWKQSVNDTVLINALKQIFVDNALHGAANSLAKRV